VEKYAYKTLGEDRQKSTEITSFVKKVRRRRWMGKESVDDSDAEC
jgi:hypothetical protein